MNRRPEHVLALKRFLRYFLSLRPAKGLQAYWKLRARPRSGHLEINIGGGQRLLLRSNKGDRQAFEEVFVDQDYAFFGAAMPRRVLDVGAHIGTTALWFLTKSPNTEIFAVEPDAANFALLTENLSYSSRARAIQATTWTSNDARSQPLSFAARFGAIRACQEPTVESHHSATTLLGCEPP